MNPVEGEGSMEPQEKPECGTWVEKPVHLKFSLGEITLTRIVFQMSVLNAHFTDLPQGAYCEWTDWPAVRNTSEGILVRSQPIADRLPLVSRTPSAIRYVPAQYQRYFVEVEGSFEDYLKKFSSHSRSNRKREVKKFADKSGGSLDYREYRSTSEVAEFLDHAVALSSRTFQERLLNSGLPGSNEYRARILELAAQDKIRAYLLFLEGRAVAYLIGEIQRPGILVILYMGYEPDLRVWSPGTVLNYKAVESVFAEKTIRMIDFTEGEGKHKQYFATNSILCADIYHFRRSIKSRVVLALHSGLSGASGAAVRLLDRLGIKAKVKKFIRSVA